MRFLLDRHDNLMKVAFMRRPHINATHRPLALLLAILIFGLGLASVYPKLHWAMHGKHNCASHCEEGGDDAPQEDAAHVCGVTLLQTGAVFNSCDVPVREAIGLIAEISVIYVRPYFAQGSYTLPPGRAPPIAGKL